MRVCFQVNNSQRHDVHEHHSQSRDFKETLWSRSVIGYRSGSYTIGHLTGWERHLANINLKTSLRVIRYDSLGHIMPVFWEIFWTKIVVRSQKPWSRPFTDFDTSSNNFKIAPVHGSILCHYPALVFDWNATELALNFTVKIYCPKEVFEDRSEMTH